MLQPLYDPERSYEDNLTDGPFGAFRDGEVLTDPLPFQSSFLGFPVALPFGIPAGPLINGKFVKAALAKGFDLPVYKTVRSRQYPCHPWPNVLAVHLPAGPGDLTLELARGGLVADGNYSDPLSITNSFGVPSFAPDVWQPDLADAVRSARPGQVVIGSFQGTSRGDGDVEGYIRDFAETARLVRETGVKMMEMNLSCPNEGTSHLLCFDTDRTRRIAEAVKEKIGDTPLILKIAYFADQAVLKEFVRNLGGLADGIAAINTIPAEIRDNAGAQALPGPGRLHSGVCGRGIKWAGLDMVRRLKELRGELGLKFGIVGVGGVSLPADYADYRAAGADAVMSATGAMWNPYLARDIRKAL